MQERSYEVKVCMMFDSFVKKVLRNYIRNLQRNENNRHNHLSEIPFQQLIGVLAHWDSYPSDVFVLCTNDISFEVKDEILYNALHELTKKQLEVLLLFYWCNQSEMEIAEEMKITTREVRYLMQNARKNIKEHYEKG